MRFFFENGLVCKNGGGQFLVDPSNAKKKQLTAVVSHAHSDHFANGHQTAWMTPQTHALLSNRHSNVKNAKKKELNKKFNVQNCGISFHNSGHILGSAQIKLESDQTTLITSDFNPMDSLLLSGAQPQKCDTLIVETTFGLPEFAFPDRETVHEQIGEWIKHQTSQNQFVILAGYALGKAQELTRIVNEFAGIVPLVHEQIARHNQTYEQFGIKLGKYIPLNHNLRESSVLILPPTLFDKQLVPALEFELNKKVVTAMATGWGYRNGFDQVFPLSDHADYNGLLEFVKACEPKQVLTMHGYTREFAHAVSRKLKIPARSLETNGQQFLSEFS